MPAPTIEVNVAATLDPTGTPENLSFPYIHDNDGTNYSFVSGTTVYDLTIKHSAEKVRGLAPAMDRHYVGITISEAPTDLFPLGTQVQAYLIFRNRRTEDQAVIAKAIAGVMDVVLPNIGPLVNRQGQF